MPTDPKPVDVERLNENELHARIVELNSQLRALAAERDGLKELLERWKSGKVWEQHRAERAEAERDGFAHNSETHKTMYLGAAAIMEELKADNAALRELVRQAAPTMRSHGYTTWLEKAGEKP